MFVNKWKLLHCVPNVQYNWQKFRYLFLSSLAAFILSLVCDVHKPQKLQLRSTCSYEQNHHFTFLHIRDTPYERPLSLRLSWSSS